MEHHISYHKFVSAPAGWAEIHFDPTCPERDVRLRPVIGFCFIIAEAPHIATYAITSEAEQDLEQSRGVLLRPDGVVETFDESFPSLDAFRMKFLGLHNPFSWGWALRHKAAEDACTAWGKADAFLGEKAEIHAYRCKLGLL